MQRYMNFITNPMKKCDFNNKMAAGLNYLKLFNIEEKYRMFDKFGRPGAAYDDAV